MEHQNVQQASNTVQHLKEFQIVGPPGTGKTTTLKRQVDADSTRYGADRVLITSLTKAAAKEISGRLDGGSSDARPTVGTLHSICYRALGEIEFVGDSPKGIRHWNEHILETGHPEWKLEGGLDPDDPVSGGGSNDLLQQASLYRHRQIPLDAWPSERVRSFHGAWSAWLASRGAIDFTGMIEAGLDFETAPGEPASILGDEAQDWTPLEAAVVRHWAAHPSVERLYLVADPDQAIFEWRGGDPRLFLDHPVPVERTKTLSQSWRVPRAVHAYAQRILARIQDRMQVEYHPRDAEGGLSQVQTLGGYRDAEFIVRKLLDRIETGGSVLLLASCRYQLGPVLSVLRKQGIPFANPYRPRSGEWNPLGTNVRKPGGAVTQVLAYLAPPYADGLPREHETRELQSFLDLLPADGVVLKKGAKKALEKLSTPWLSEEVEALFANPELLLLALQRDPSWLLQHALGSQRKRIAFPLRVAECRGVQALVAKPSLCVGTVHSVKGGEADHVFLLNDLSPQQQYGLQDPLHRVMYVGATRARESLTLLCNPRGYFA